MPLWGPGASPLDRAAAFEAWRFSGIALAMTLQCFA
jgi:hypothetical protein